MDVASSSITVAQSGVNLLFGTAKIVDHCLRKRKQNKRATFINADKVGLDKIVISFHPKARKCLSFALELLFLDVDPNDATFNANFFAHLNEADAANALENNVPLIGINAFNTKLELDIATLALVRTHIYEHPSRENVNLLDPLSKQITELGMKRKALLEVRSTITPDVMKDYARSNFLESNEMATIKQLFLGKILSERKFSNAAGKLIKDLTHRKFICRTGLILHPDGGPNRFQISICNHNYAKKADNLIFETLVIKTESTDWVAMVKNVTNDTLTQIRKLQNEKNQETTTERERELNDRIRELELKNKMLTLLAQNISLKK
jgi:hypothetical protein